jgi:CHRD domain
MRRSLVKARRWMVVLALVVLGAWLLAAPVSAAVPVDLAANLKGANQVPKGSGDPDGSGWAYVSVAPGKVCYTISVQGIKLPATEAHIHKGAKGVNGNVVVTLQPPDQSGISGGCTAVKPALSKQIQNNPANYYVNIHNKDFPEGAVRGQLQKQNAPLPQ